MLRPWLGRGLAAVGYFCLAYLVVSTPKFQEKPCPVLGSTLHQANPNLEDSNPLQEVDCQGVMRGEKAAVAHASQFPWCLRNDAVSDYDYINMEKDHFLLFRGYLDAYVTVEEREFPLAFSILMYENVEQFERLLRAIYRAQNVYCIHVDAKSARSVLTAVEVISSFLPNVFIASQRIDVHWGEFSLLEAELSCLRELYNHTIQWKYYINLTGREFPLKTNRELVKILKAYNGANDVDGTLHRRPILWTKYVWRNENWRTSVEKEDAPHGFLVAKGSTHVAVTRAFVDYALNDPRARDLLEWMRDIRAPDEHFFPTLNHNPHLGVPGAYKGDPDLKWFYTRLKIWWNEKNTEPCHGQWIRFICNLGVGDLSRLVGAKQMFVNKVRLEQDPVAFFCLEQWHMNRTRHPEGSDLDVEFYAKRDFVLNHV